MSRLRIFAAHAPNTPLSTTSTHADIAATLKTIGVDFERWEPSHPVQPGDAPEAILAAYRSDIDRLMSTRGFKSVDVVSIAPDNPNREVMRAKFLDEHRHAEDEVRFFVAGRGLFTLHIEDMVYAVLCEKNDLISVPAGTRHWFDMGEQPSFVAIRLFNNPDGWTAQFTGERIADQFPRLDD